MAGPNRRAPIDYLIVGHLSRDQTPQGYRLGGTAAYSGLTARALGVRVGLVTAAGPDIDTHPLRRLKVHSVDSPESTSYINDYSSGERELRLLSRALDLDLDNVPKDWRQPRILHLGPIADEIDPQLAQAFPRAKVLLTPQGWLRSWDAEGRVRRKSAQDVFGMLPRADIAVLSEEDIDASQEWIDHLAEKYPLFVLTAAERGARVFQRGKATHVPAPEAETVDPVGAGDIFASAFVIRYDETNDPLEAARFANQLATRSVEREGLESVPTEEDIEAARGER